jgi:ligand-binding sensor domain-containing protein
LYDPLTMSNSALAVNLRSSSRRSSWFFAQYAGAIVLLVGSACALARGEPTSQALTEMYHPGWTIRDDVPSSIEAIAQTPHGYIWLGTDTGLFRFDGKSFERYHPTSGEDLLPKTIPSLMATSDGGLWIGYAAAGASYLKDGHNINFGEREGLNAGVH